MSLKEINLDIQFNKKTGKVKRLKLEKLAKPVADFVKHLNFVLSETPYAVGFVNEQKYTSNRKIKKLITGIDDEDRLRIDFTFYHKRQKIFDKGLGYVTIDFDEETDLEECNDLEFFEFSNSRGIKNYFDKMKDYDFSRIFEYYLNSQKFK